MLVSDGSSDDMVSPDPPAVEIYLLSREASLLLSLRRRKYHRPAKTRIMIVIKGIATPMPILAFVERPLDGTAVGAVVADSEPVEDVVVAPGVLTVPATPEVESARIAVLCVTKRVFESVSTPRWTRGASGAG